MAQYNYEIGSTSSLTNVESLTVPVPPPKSIYKPYSQMIGLGDGTVRGAGWPTAEWRWGYLTQAQRDQLRTFCTGASSNVYIRTRIMDTADSYAYFQAVMVWPIESEERDASRRIDFAITFQKLVQYTP